MDTAATEIRPLLAPERQGKAHVGIFMSGSGTNAQRVLEHLATLGSNAPLEVSAIVTDAPETSRARELGKQYGIPLVELDIREFYHAHGETRVSIATPRGQEVRQLWTDELRKLIAPYKFDFAIFAGFVPLTNLTGDFPCLNVHPGDLTYTEEGRRTLVGLHTIPIERAILSELPYMRSSVIIAQAYTGQGGEMDSGPILGISPEVTIDLEGHALSELRDAFTSRPALRPKGGFGDVLEGIAKNNQEKLKVGGDWVVLPRVVVDFAEGRYGLDAEEKLYYRIGSQWQRVETIVYFENGRKDIIKK